MQEYGIKLQIRSLGKLFNEHFRIDIAEIQADEGHFYLFVAIKRTVKLRMSAGDVMVNRIER